MAIKKFLSLLKTRQPQSDKNFKNWIKTTTGFTPRNLALYAQAFSHRSISTKKLGVPHSNERLEFLGDAVLGAIIADYLFERYPLKDEGFLTLLRSKIVNGQYLKDLALKFGFENFLKTGLTKDERTKSSAFGDAFEAFVGAVYLDLGYVKVKKFVVTRIVNTHVDVSSLANSNHDFKSQLQIHCQKNKLQLEYKLLNEEKQGSQKLYVIQVFIDGKPYTRFENYSKRVAEQKAAELTLETLKTNGEAFFKHQ